MKKSWVIKVAPAIIAVLLMFLIRDLIIRLNAHTDQIDTMMDTVVRITAFGPNAPRAAEKALERMREIDSLMNPYLEGSDLYRINNASGIESVKVSPDTIKVLTRAVYYADLTNGLFDPTIWPLMRLWAITPDSKSIIPSEQEIRQVLTLVNYKNIVISEEENSVFLQRAGMGIDLGAIAKGYAVDEAIRVLRENGISRALVNAGGNTYALGKKADGTAWRIGVQHPRRLDDFIARINITDGTAVTSGDYQRYFEVDGQRYHHIINPRSGMPARGVMSVTVFGSSSMDCDALSTSAFVLGVEQGVRLIENLHGFEALVIDSDGRSIVTSGLKGMLEIFPWEGSGFKE